MMHRHRLLTIWISLAGLLAVACLIPTQATPQTADTITSSKKSTAQPEAIASALHQLEERINRSQKGETPENAAQLGIGLSDLQQRTRMLIQIREIYNQLSTVKEKEADLLNEEAFLNEKRVSLQQQGISEKQPYTLSYFDSLKSDLSALEQHAETLENAIHMAKQSLDATVEKEQDLQRQIRLLRDQKDQKTPETAAGTAWRIQMAELQAELANANAMLERAVLANHQLEKRTVLLKTDIAQKQVQWIRDKVAFDEKDLTRQMTALDKKRIQAEKVVRSLMLEKKNADAMWLKTMAKASKAVYREEIVAAESELKQWETWKNVYQSMLEQSESIIRLTDSQKEMWQTRYALTAGAVSLEKTKKWQDQAKTEIKRLANLITLEQSRQIELFQQLESLEKKSQENRPDLTVDSVKSQIEALRKLADHRQQYLAALFSGRQLNERFLDELGDRAPHHSWREQLSRVQDQVIAVWQFELWVIDAHPVTVSKIVLALAILFSGIIATRTMMNRFARKFLAKAQLKQTTASTIEKLFLYVSYLLLVLLVLRIVNIPLAAFAFLGGAVAIGVGFGAQNLINNFISGFIIMGEQPISIGDLIEVDGVLGKVEEIGARCTRVRTGENIDILVPNSSFLEKSITNWTLADNKIRAHVTVGVIYGSPVNEARKLMLRAVIEHPDVLKTPEPFVLFQDFGDNALIFEVHFWISIRRVVERRIIESDTRFRIDDLFREAGLVIAFPQRDVHLDTQRPLDIRILSNAPNNGRSENE